MRSERVSDEDWGCEVCSCFGHDGGGGGRGGEEAVVGLDGGVEEDGVELGIGGDDVFDVGL